MKTIAYVDKKVNAKVSRTYDGSLNRMGNFTMLSNLVLYDTQITPIAKLVFWALAESAKERRFPDGHQTYATSDSVQTLSTKIGISVSSVSRGLRKLRDRELILRETAVDGLDALTELLALDTIYPEYTSKQNQRHYADSLKKAGQYSRLSNYVCWDSNISATAKLVFWGLVSHANGHSLTYADSTPAYGAYPGIKGLSMETGVSTRGIDRALVELLSRKLIHRTLWGKKCVARTCLLPIERIYLDDAAIKKLPVRGAKK